TGPGCRSADGIALEIGRTLGAGPRTGLGQVADPYGRTARRGGVGERVGGAVVVHAVAALGHVAVPGCGTAQRRALVVGRTRGRETVAELRHIAVPRRRAAHRTPVPGDVLAIDAAPVT